VFLTNYRNRADFNHVFVQFNLVKIVHSLISIMFLHCKVGAKWKRVAKGCGVGCSCFGWSKYGSCCLLWG